MPVLAATLPFAVKKSLRHGITLNGIPMTELRDVTCHVGSHSVTCYPTQVNVPRSTQASTPPGKVN